MFRQRSLLWVNGKGFIVVFGSDGQVLFYLVWLTGVWVVGGGVRKQKGHPKFIFLSPAAFGCRQQEAAFSGKIFGWFLLLHWKAVEQTVKARFFLLLRPMRRFNARVPLNWTPIQYKGQAGKIAVIGGCREYTGAPYFAATSPSKYYKSYSPELIVHPVLEESYSVRDEEKASVCAKVLGEVNKWMERFDCIVVGPGLGRDPFLLDCVGEIMRQARESKPTVIDGSSLFTRIGGPTILRKGKTDLISDGLTVDEVDIFGSPRRCGGQGDILSGSVAVFSSWARQRLAIVEESYKLSNVNPMVLGSIAGSALLRKAASFAYANKKRSTLTTDIIDYLGRSLEHICPAN
ncbi:hypothetical protein HPP92_005291 [Vanilla planifolia]|uniref:ATP-dependent (S)-NAD(P)H-hydrate dehydratase n=1 Tax=Vanilla planifolia TaxID=51239 RepID=A0A835RZ82_VANPL|nr:hypothetical protein HPP92_005291 [Vanilla planifolia]